MKKLFAALVLAAVMASPVMAQEYIPSSVPNGEAAYPATSSGFTAFASAPMRTRTVRQQNSHFGTDPDANVRLQLQNEIDSLDR